MMYKTMILELLQDRPEMYDQLLTKRTLLQTLNHYAEELRDIHHTWMGRLWQTNPHSAASQIAAEALELALEQLVRRLPSEFPANEDELLSLDAAMAFIRPHTSHA
jgi:hypothetical protein